MSIRLEQVQKQTQKLIMSPQMQQAIQLLQLPLMELSTLIQQEMVSNPVLEEDAPEENGSSSKTEQETPEQEIDFEDEFSRLAELDNEWREYYQQSGSYRRVSDDEEKKRRFYEESITTQET